jgi:non-ribosomal peptide synthetase-like protein
MINETMSASSFKIGQVKIGDRNYLGNYLHIPPDMKVGENVLIATKALAPIDGAIRVNTGLLGSPPFEIPRATSRDLEMSQVDDETRIRQLHKKNRHNFVTAVLYLLSNWFLVFMEVGFLLLMYALFPFYGLLAVYGVSAAGFVAGILWMWVVERGVLGFGNLEPRIVPLREPYFWFHERTWKMTGLWFVAPVFSGTPFKTLIAKMEGVKVGKKVFDDGAYFDEYTLITIGDYSSLNSFCVIQPHSLEETVFKSGRVKMGVGCTIGCAANLHYDITMGDYVAIEQNAFVMKGEIIDDDETWRGNPARAAGGAKAAPAVEAAVAA